MRVQIYQLSRMKPIKSGESSDFDRTIDVEPGVRCYCADADIAHWENDHPVRVVGAKGDAVVRRPTVDGGTVVAAERYLLSRERSLDATRRLNSA